MGNYNSIDVSRLITNERTGGNSIVRNNSGFNPEDWRGTMRIENHHKTVMSEADMKRLRYALDQNTRLFAFLAAEGKSLGYGDPPDEKEAD